MVPPPSLPFSYLPAIEKNPLGWNGNLSTPRNTVSTELPLLFKDLFIPSKTTIPTEVVYLGKTLWPDFVCV